MNIQYVDVDNKYKINNDAILNCIGTIINATYTIFSQANFFRRF